ncbi:hypothetical protein RJ55_05330 [Drechmeria coniospora]|nr:hypothetical protein RJ55_05330 [Drechmeria coniospora]
MSHAEPVLENQPQEEEEKRMAHQKSEDVDVDMPYTLLSKNERRCITALIAFAAWFSTLSSFIFYPAISRIASDLGTTTQLIHITVTAYLLVSGVAPSILGGAADSFGRRPVYLLALTLYVGASIGCTLQNSLPALLVLRVAQAAGISATVSVAYGVVADIAPPSERGAYVGAVSFGITTAPSIGPVIGGALAHGPGWRWIFGFLAIASGVCLAAIMVCLPETNRGLVGNGGSKPPPYCNPLFTAIIRPWKRNHGPEAPLDLSKAGAGNPLKSLAMLGRKDTATNIVAGGILYVVYCCVHTSLSSTFIQVYSFNELQAGLVYLSFGAGAVLSTLVSAKLIDHDYHVTAKTHGLPEKHLNGDELLSFPIEKARMRSVCVPSVSSVAFTVLYGWLADKAVHFAAVLTVLFFMGWSIQTCFNIINTILIDINQDAPATAQAAFNLVRCILAAAFIACLQEMIDGIGLGWTFTILGSCCSVSALLFFVESRYGWSWRLARNSVG